MLIKLDYRRAEQKKCFHPPSLSSDKNAGKSVAWSTTLRECGRGCGAAGVRGKINAENEIHPLIMDGRGRRRRQRQIPTEGTAEKRGKRSLSQKMERDESNGERERETTLETAIPGGGAEREEGGIEKPTKIRAAIANSNKRVWAGESNVFPQREIHATVLRISNQRGEDSGF